MRDTLPWGDSTTRVRGRNYRSLTGSRSFFWLVPGGMVSYTRYGQRRATGVSVIGRDSRRRRASRDTLPWGDSTTRVTLTGNQGGKRVDGAELLLHHRKGAFTNKTSNS